MKKILMVATLSLALTACGQAEEEVETRNELGDYNAAGADPGWNLAIKGEKIKLETDKGKGFEVDVHRTKTIDGGHQITGFSGDHNVKIRIYSDQCENKGEDAGGADKVEVSATGSMTMAGCGGETSSAAEPSE